MKDVPWFKPFRLFQDEIDQLIRDLGEFADWDGLMVRSRVTETGREVVAVAEIPKLYDRHDLDIRVVEGHLLVRGGTESEETKGRGDSPFSQRSEMFFMLTLPLPAPVDPSRMKTDLKKNILTVRLPKRSS